MPSYHASIIVALPTQAPGCFAGTGRVVLVGDPRQLPPTVLSHEADKALAQSLFQRLENAGWPRTMLQEQYRSHPAISAFPSR